ncbi:hypothetical protein WJX73_006118 [Symbiochloris irregularis]|uniref:Uncharacterized protein n=1 Tax=Symbiochloris irregularis TaxID=706552 RepID=A0AAW1NHR0_9CHLO
MAAAASRKLPTAVLGALHDSPVNHQAAIDSESGTCAVFSRGEILIWQGDAGAGSQVATRTLPYAPSGHSLLSLQVDQGGRATVIICTEDGNLTIWLDVTGENVQTSTHRIAGGRVCAITAALTETSLQVVAVLDSGALHCTTGRISDEEDLQLTSSSLKATAPAEQPQAVTQTPRRLGRLWGRQGASDNPLSHGVTTSPGRPHALELVSHPTDSSASLLLALDAAGLDCWQINADGGQFLWRVSLPQEATEQGLVSADTVLKARSLSVTDAGAGGYLLRRAIILSDTAVQPGAHEQVILVASLPGAGPAQLEAAHALGEGAHFLQCKANPLADSFLLWDAGSASQLSLPGLQPVQLPSPLLQAALAPDAAHWLLLHSSGFMRLPVRAHRGSPVRTAPPLTPAAAPHIKQESPSVSPDASESARDVTLPGHLMAVPPGSAERVAHILDTAFRMEDPSAAHNLYAPLEAAHAFSGDGPSNPLVMFSAGVVDALPKHWGGASGTSAVAQHLADKLHSHAMLLQMLQASGALAPLTPASLRAIMQHAEMAAALLALRQHENEVLSESQGQPGQWHPLQECIHLAGASIKPRASAGGEERSEWELCFACPSHTAAAFLEALSATAERLMPLTIPAQMALDQVVELVEAIKAFVDGARRQREAQAVQLPRESRAVQHGHAADWLSEFPSQQAHTSLTNVLIELYHPLSAESPERVRQRTVVLSTVAEWRLDVMAAAAAAEFPPNTLPSAVSAEAAAANASYVREKDILLGMLYADARMVDKQELEAEEREQASLGRAQGVSGRGTVGPHLLDRVESLAVAHHSYYPLVELCDLNSDEERLHAHMRRSMQEGGRPGLHAENEAANCAEFVFAHFLQLGELQRLLQLPDEFNDALAQWLLQQGNEHQIVQLRAMHAARMGRYDTAQQQHLQAAHDPRVKLQQSDHHLVQAKLALLAAQPNSLTGPTPQEEELVRQVEGDQVLADIQWELGLQDEPLMSPQQLAEAVLAASSVTHTPLVFDVLAAAGHDFRIANQHMAVEAWRRLVTGSDWEAVRRQAPRMSDEDMQALLATVPVATAAARCYAPQPEIRALCVGPSMHEALPQSEVQGVIAGLVEQWTSSDRQRCLDAFMLGCIGAQGVTVA